jgi:hypothetical protein
MLPMTANGVNQLTKGKTARQAAGNTAPRAKPR